MNFAKVDGAGYFEIKNGYLKVVGTSASIPLNWIKKGGDIDGESERDQSGYSVSLSNDGDTVAIGAIGHYGPGKKSGHVRVYKYDDNDGWTQKGGDIDGESERDQSGYSVSLSDNGDTVAIGAIFNDGNGGDSGHVRVYEYDEFNDNKTWTQKGGDIDGEVAGDQSGYSVSLSGNGDTVAIGAIYNDGNGENSGHVRVYKYGVEVDGSGWFQKGGDIDGEAAFDLSGGSVSLSNDGDTVAIGARYNDDNGTYSGHVRVYEYDETNHGWIKKGSDIDGEAARDYSGISVSLSNDGDTVAIGAIGSDGNGDDSGHVRVYQYDGNNWIKKGIDIDGEAAGDYSGRSVSLSNNGKTVAIGARQNYGDNGYRSGHVRVYEFK